MPSYDPEVRFSPAWWMKTLGHRQSRRLNDTTNGLHVTPGLRTLNLWLDNTPPLPPGAPEWLPAFQDFHKDTRTNFAEPLVRSATDRMKAIGFRTGASDDDNGDQLAEQVWIDSNMQVQQVELFADMLGQRDGYTMVVPDPDGGRFPVITAMDPRQVITAHDPIRSQVVRAAMNTYHDPDEDIDVAWIYIRSDKKDEKGWAYKATKPSSRNVMWGANFRYTAAAWEWAEPEQLPTNKVPIVRFPNRKGKAEFEPHLGILGRLNRITLQRMLISEMQAFRQRAVEGLPDVYPNDYPIPEMRGKPIDYEGVFTPGPGSLWQVPPGVKFWESQSIDVRPTLAMEQHEIRTYAALAGMPVYYFNPSDTQGSAEGASTQKESLTFRVEDRRGIAEVGLAQTMAHAFEQMGETQRADPRAIETIWAPAEHLSLTEQYNAATQAKSAGLADRTIRREILRFSPRQMRASEDDDARQRVLERRDMLRAQQQAQANGQQQNQQTSRQTDQQQTQRVQPREQR